MERILFRLSDQRIFWESRGGSAIQYEALRFSIHDNHGEYLSLSYGERKAAVFPFEAFTIYNEDFYYGPRPLAFGLTFPSELRPIRPAGIGHPEAAGLTCFAQLSGIIIRCCIQIIFKFAITPGNTSAEGKVRWSVFVLLASIFIPALSIAPVPEASQVMQLQMIVSTFQLAENARQNAHYDELPRSHLETSEPPGKEFAKDHTRKKRQNVWNESPNSICKIGHEELQLMTLKNIERHVQSCRRNSRLK